MHAFVFHFVVNEKRYIAMSSSILSDSSDFAAKSKRLMALLNRLQALGAHLQGVDRPIVVVCGDQSAGKSSILQRICEVSLPRSEGTCTRCPTEVIAAL